MSQQKVILGGPGCGKTTYLLSVVEQELSSGLSPKEIAFVAFTRKAAHEALERAKHKFGFTEDDLPYFRTLHSFAFRQLALSPNEIMAEGDYKALGEALNLTFGDIDDEFGLHVPDNKGNQMAYLEQLARLQMKPLDEVCRTFRMQKYYNVQHYADSLIEYKRARGVFDFTDMLEMFINHGSCPQFKVVIIDEAQDLSPLQWRVVNRITQGAERVYIAGDDDQAIYEWSGADIKTFLSLRGDIHVLPISHRLPRAIFDKANGLVSRIRNRYSKQWEPRGEGGEVVHHNAPEQVDFSQDTWLLLARNRYMLSSMLEVLRRQGFPYLYMGRSSTDTDAVHALTTWEILRRGEERDHSDIKLLYSKLRTGGHVGGGFTGADPDKRYTFSDCVQQFGLNIPREEDWMTALRIPEGEREYYRAIRRRGESMIKPPRILVSTIHQVKGGEADHVLLRTDMSYACYRQLVRNPDSETRVFYVGATRARKSLHIIYPRTNKFYAL